jgi:nucleoside-diphosphate-sugar epimerase/phosphohistidine swiveling domain-containing protein
VSFQGCVLVTGGTGAFGSATTKWLPRAGHDVVVFARNEPPALSKGARFVKGDIGDADSVRRAMAGCDTVVHLAWALSGSITHAQAELINIDGTRNVLRAMADTECQRLVFASSVTAYGAHTDHPQPWLEYEKLDPAYGLVYEWHKAQAEAMIAESGVEAVRVRPTVVVGRGAHNAPANVYRQLVIPSLGGAAKIQMVHQDDVGRFFAHACESTAVGPVNLAADDVLTWSEVARLARRPAAPTPPRLVVPAARALSKVAPVARSAPELIDMFLHWPVADTTRLKEVFGFRLGYTSAEAIADQGRHSTSHIALGMKEIRRPAKLDRSAPLKAAQGDDAGRFVQVLSGAACGEFDTPRADPNYPEWTCANLAEAFPGPMTPLSLELIRDALFTGADQVATMLPLDERVRDNVRRRQLAIFGHRFYQNVSVLCEMASATPGQTPEDFNHLINGEPYPDGYVRPQAGFRDVVGYLKFAASAGPRLAGIGRAVSEVERRASEVALNTDALGALTNERLTARIEMLWDDCIAGWKVGLLCTFLVSAPTAILERRYGTAAVTQPQAHAAGLASSCLLRGVKELARHAKGRPEARAALAGEIDAQSWIQLQRADPDYACQVQALVDAAGHRGPGETELSNAVYADAPWLLLRAVAGVSDAAPRKPVDAQPRDLVARLLTKASWSMIAQRERCRDAVMRLTHQLRLALREQGSRMVARGLLAERGDIFYLTSDTVFSANADLAATVSRRRAERDRLTKLDLPLRFIQPMDLSESAVRVGPQRTISGVPAVSGIAVGRVRVLRSPDDELEPGEVLVARVTDTGWTPYFGAAAAVVTDIGGSMSHASIVAREFGIPAIVGTKHGSQVLTDGQLVEVNGSTGVVTVLD